MRKLGTWRVGSAYGSCAIGSSVSASATARRCGSIKEGGAFYAPGPLQCVAVHWPKLVAGAQSGELYHLEVQE